MSTKVSVVFHHEDGKWWAEAPDVPDYVAGANTLDELRTLVKEGLEFHLGRPVDIVETTTFDFKVTHRAEAIQLSTSPSSRPVHFAVYLTPVAPIVDLSRAPAGAPSAVAPTEEPVAS